LSKLPNLTPRYSFEQFPLFTNMFAIIRASNRATDPLKFSGVARALSASLTFPFQCDHFHWETKVLAFLCRLPALLSFLALSRI